MVSYSTKTRVSTPHFRPFPVYFVQSFYFCSSSVSVSFQSHPIRSNASHQFRSFSVLILFQFRFRPVPASLPIPILFPSLSRFCSIFTQFRFRFDYVPLRSVIVSFMSAPLFSHPFYSLSFCSVLLLINIISLFLAGFVPFFSVPFYFCSRSILAGGGAMRRCSVAALTSWQCGISQHVWITGSGSGDLRPPAPG